MARLLLFAAALAGVLGAADAADVELACPKGSVLREVDRDAACETPGGVAEGPFWSRRPDGTLRVWGNAHGGQTEGRWLGFHPSGAKSIEATYRAGQLVGPFRMWSQDGHLVYAGTHDAQGEMDGTWTRWWPNGKERLRFAMRHGRAHGAVTAWWERGGKRFEGERRDGLREGEWIWWDESGAEVARCRYERDAVVDGACGSMGPD